MNIPVYPQEYVWVYIRKDQQLPDQYNINILLNMTHEKIPSMSNQHVHFIHTCIRSYTLSIIHHCKLTYIYSSMHTQRSSLSSKKTVILATIASRSWQQVHWYIYTYILTSIENGLLKHSNAEECHLRKSQGQPGLVQHAQSQSWVRSTTMVPLVIHIHAYTYTYIHTYIHTYTHTHVQILLYI